jgi:hypothetical protein
MKCLYTKNYRHENGSKRWGYIRQIWRNGLRCSQKWNTVIIIIFLIDMWTGNVCILKLTVLGLCRVCCFLSCLSKLTSAVKPFAASVVFIHSEMYTVADTVFLGPYLWLSKRGAVGNFWSGCTCGAYHCKITSICMVIGRLNGRDSSKLFLHELESKMLHLHEMFVWLMTVIEELLQATGSVIISLFVTWISVLRSKGSAWWRLKLPPFTARWLLYIA